MLVTVQPPGLPETRNHSRAISAAARPVSRSPASAFSRLMTRIAFTRSRAENRRAVRYDTLLRARTAGAYGHRRFHSGISARNEHIANIGKSCEFPRQYLAGGPVRRT